MKEVWENKGPHSDEDKQLWKEQWLKDEYSPIATFECVKCKNWIQLDVRKRADSAALQHGPKYRFYCPTCKKSRKFLPVTLEVNND